MANNSKALIQWNEKKQEMDGFGCAQAGWSWHLYAHTKREELMDRLFGESGLQLNTLRGEVFPDYSPAPGEYNFETTADIDVPFDDPIFEEETKKGNRYGQLWIARQARKVHNVDNLMFSTWSPPGYMKTNNDPTRGGYLKPEEYQNFAELLVAFCKAYRSVGLDVNVISPTNEPEFPLVWNSCTWVKGENTLAPFVINNLYPTLQRENLNPKIILGECAQWGPFLRVFGAIPYLTGVFENYPEIAQLNTIAAGHGYVDPITQEDTEITVIPYTEELGLKSWVTEISREESFSPGIENGVAWAVKFHKYLTQANVSSIIWWAGAQPNYTSETIIGIDDDRVSYTLTKRYHTFGHYTRYVKPGSNRVEIALDENVPEEVKVSAFRKDNEYAVIAINPTDTEVIFSISLDGSTPTGTLQPILTDDTNDWSELAGIPLNEDNSYTVTLPPVSVMTFIGASN